MSLEVSEIRGEPKVPLPSRVVFWPPEERPRVVPMRELMTELDEEISQLESLEKEAREIVAHGDEPNYMKRTKEWQEKLEITLKRLWTTLETLTVDKVKREYILPWELTISLYKMVVGLPDIHPPGFMKADIKRCIEMNIETPSQCYPDRRFLEDVGPMVEGTGKYYLDKSIFPRLKDSLETGEKYTLTEEIDDTRNAIRELLNLLKEIRGRVKRRHKRYVVYENSDPRAEELAKIWAETAEKYARQGLYHRYDYARSIGIVRGDKVTFYMGYYRNRTAHVYLKNNRVNFYDSTEVIPPKYFEPLSVKKVMYDLLTEHANCKCKINNVGVFCSRCNLEKAVKILAGAISGLFRLEHRCQYADQPPEVAMEEEKELILELADIL